MERGVVLRIVFYLLVFWMFLEGHSVLAQSCITFQGNITDEEGNSLPYSAVSFNHLQIATVADERGAFKVEVPPGKYLLEISYLGYHSFRDTILINRDTLLGFALEEAPFFLDEQVISAGEEDMGRRLIRRAINNKEALAIPFPLYQYHAYTKTVLRFPDYFPFDSLLNRTLSPFRSKKDKAAGKPPRRPAWLPPELDSDILYLSENISEVSLKGKKIKERILHSRVSGDLTRFSFVGNLVTRFDPYKNRTQIAAVTERGLISPLSDKAFMYYDYKLIGHFGEGAEKTYKIEVKPKRRFDPVFSGYLYLADSSFAVRKLDLWATSDQYLDLLDSLWVHQEYLPLEGKWVPFRSTMSVTFSFDLVLIKVPLQGRVTSLLYDYETDPEVPKKYFNREVLLVEPGISETRDFIDSIRPLPLSLMEEGDYRLKDSLRLFRNGDAYEDSLRKSRNRLTLANVVLLGQSFSGKGKWNSLNFEHLLSSVGFNPMEGWFVRPHLTFGWDLKEGGDLLLDTRFRYAFSEEKFSYSLGLTWRTLPKKNEKFYIEGGDYISQFSRFPQIGFWPNTQATLLDKNSYMKLYRKRYAEIGYGREVLNGVNFEAGIRYENRRPMPNLTEFSWFSRTKQYDPNLSFTAHKALIGEISVYIQPFNKYISTPTDKIDLGSFFPLITVNYAHGFGGIAEGAASFSRMSLSLSRKLGFGMLGSSEWRVTAGRFFSKKQLYFPDYYHFKSNRTFSRPAGHDAFFLTDYYENSTAEPFFEAHFQHDFSGFLFNKIPLLRRLRVREFVGLHYLILENQRPYLEANVGLEKLFFKVLSIRFDLYFTLISQGEARGPSLKFLPPTILINLTK